MKALWEKLKVKWNIQSDKRMAWIFIIFALIYQILLFSIGSVLGEHQFVKWFVLKMNKRIFPFLQKKL
jgi:type IV secretory pathway component VirB8